MSNLHLTADFGIETEKYNVELSLVEFEEDRVMIIYAPALDLSGYGYTPKEARESFSEGLQEFFRYTFNNNTLNSVLQDLGWTIKGSNKVLGFYPPKDSDLIAINPLYNEIVNNKDYGVSRVNNGFAI